jgi:precorrin-3B synthase
MNYSLRGACPGLSAPTPTGDGLLVRLRPIGTVSLAAFEQLCATARKHGNGVIEVTARGSIQVRGLSVESAPLFADAVATLGIAVEDALPILSNPLAGLDAEEILDTAALAADLMRALARTSLAKRLAPKVSVVIDGGGALGLDGISADLRLCAEATPKGAAFLIAVGGNGAGATELGVVGLKNAVETALRLLEVIAQSGSKARSRDVLASNSSVSFRSAIADLLVADAAPRQLRKVSRAIGIHPLRDGSLARGIGLAFGHAEAVVLERMAEAAHAAGAIGIRTAPGRTLMIIGLAPRIARSFGDTADELGFIVSADDPRRHVFACAGAPICSSAHIAARAIAPRIAEAAAPYLDASLQIHISGCAKGCAHAGVAVLTIVGAPQRCEIVANGCVRDVPFAAAAPHELPAAIARYAREAKRETSQREIRHD